MAERRGPTVRDLVGGGGGGHDGAGIEEYEDRGAAGGIRGIERGLGDRLAGAHLHSAWPRESQSRQSGAHLPGANSALRRKTMMMMMMMIMMMRTMRTMSGEREIQITPHSRCISLRAYLPHWRTARSTFSVRPSYFPSSFYPVPLQLFSFIVSSVRKRVRSSRSIVDILAR